MSPDEIFALIGSWSSVYARGVFGGGSRFSSSASPPPRPLKNIKLVVALMLSGGPLFAPLASFASHDVRDSVVYMSYYMVMGAAVGGLLLGWLVLDRITEPGEPITIERTMAASASARSACSGSPSALKSGPALPWSFARPTLHPPLCAGLKKVWRASR
jgi:hypothetical protein